jgi:NAD(P)-dependent dehydrogenase (short-subunit alcohol dehydrogenase family)
MCCAPSSANPQANQRWQAHAGLIDSWGDPHHLPHPYAWRWIGYHLTAASRQSQLDGLLHNAGVISPPLPLEHTTLESWDQLLRVNLTAPYALTRHCLPLLRQAQQASVIFTSSTAGRELRAYWGPYAIAKHGVENVMQLFFDELRNTSHIRFNSLNPGPCSTALRRVAFPSENPASKPTPDQLMPLYLYLMGADSLHENGKQFSAQPDQA